MFQSSLCLSDVDVKLSQVNVLLSEINVIISKCPDQVQSKKLQLLPRVDQILSELTFVVSFAQDDCSSDDDENDDIRSLEWDDKFNHYDDYYDLYIGDEEVLELRDELEHYVTLFPQKYRKRLRDFFSVKNIFMVQIW